ncbi:uncharacterized protein V1477_003498 [Vespula maculifrons]|uniref:Uncharacterized protein n=1 Tax=Vespula maculifrons TaxID=7453 RepID=A0ABD2CSV4_VESMC
MIDGRAWRSTCQSRRDNWIFQKNVSLASREHFLGSGRALAEFEERRARERVIIITSHARIPPLVISILNLNRIVVVVPVGVGTATATATAAAAGGRNMPLVIVVVAVVSSNNSSSSRSSNNSSSSRSSNNSSSSRSSNNSSSSRNSSCTSRSSNSTDSGNNSSSSSSSTGGGNGSSFNRIVVLFERTLQKLPRWERYNVWLEYCQYQRKSDASNVRYSVMLVVDASNV